MVNPAVSWAIAILYVQLSALHCHYRHHNFIGGFLYVAEYSQCICVLDSVTVLVNLKNNLNQML